VKKSRHAAGWRGLSVDIIMNPGEYPLDNASGKGGGEENVDKEGGIVGADERLDGGVVKLIWSKSRLDKGKLRNIW
jgi:hypothetical protein